MKGEPLFSMPRLLQKLDQESIVCKVIIQVFPELSDGIILYYLVRKKRGTRNCVLRGKSTTAKSRELQLRTEKDLSGILRVPSTSLPSFPLPHVKQIASEKIEPAKLEVEGH